MFSRSVYLSALTAATTVLAGTNEEGLKFLEENKAREGVVTLPSGLQYKVLKKGKGKYAPTKDSPCECHYAGTTPALTPDMIDKDEADWAEFDSSYKRGEPTTFAPNQVIKGWTEAMQLMVEGDKWEMYIPSELGYGDGGSGAKIKGGDVLVFRMEILKINGKKKRVVKCDFAAKEGCDEDELSAWEKWGSKDLAAVDAEVARLTAKSQETMKKGMREGIVADLKMIKLVQKAKKPKKEKKPKGPKTETKKEKEEKESAEL
ncbi:unnamed protein product [Amoebophrya sp. A120]|nr:unnamed protein product [Amoebophrya sp. A120]|eukprot:GSA120T00023379001.1